MSSAATPSALRKPVERFIRNGDVAFGVGLLLVVVILILPMPTWMLDITLTLSIGVSIFLLLIIIGVKDPTEFSGFPTLLLVATLFRLALNIASTRLILGQGYAGEVINTFGTFVTAGSVVVGTIIFLILILINFIVITKGAGRIAEVAARFTLDAMPGKQMAIDAELNAGLIDEKTATARREKIQKEADFYGRMDGASKFVRGDAIAGFLITLVNVIGGFFRGIVTDGLTLQESLAKYTTLTIGDGLVSQVPALIVSIGAAILITRAIEPENLGSSLARQIAFYPRAMLVVGSSLVALAILPGMPFLPFITLGAFFLALGFVVRRSGLTEEDFSSELAKARAVREGKPEDGKAPEAPTEAEQARTELQRLIDVDVLAIELGYGLLNLADREKGGDLLDRITGVRKSFAREMGLLVPPIAVRDNLEMEANEYRFLLRGKQVARSLVVPNRWLAMNVTGSPVELKGIATKEPVFGLDAVWITEDEKRSAEVNGYTVVDPASVLITHLSEVLKQFAYLVISREDTQTLVDFVKAKNQTLVSELIPDQVNVGVIHRVLQNLLKESIPIKNLTIILEGISEFCAQSKNPDDLSEFVRRKLGVYFVPEYEYETGKVKAMTLDPRLEQYLIARVQRGKFEVGLSIDPPVAQHLLEELSRQGRAMIDAGLPFLLLTTSELRLGFKRFFESSFPKLVVLSYHELPPHIEIQNFVTIPPPKNFSLENSVVPASNQQESSVEAV